MCPGLGSWAWGLALEHGAFPAEGLSRAGRKEVGRGRKVGEGGRMGQASAGSEFSPGLARKRGHLDWPGREAVGLVTLARAWMSVWWRARKENKSHPHLCNRYKNTTFLGWMGVKNEVRNIKLPSGPGPAGRSCLSALPPWPGCPICEATGSSEARAPMPVNPCIHSTTTVGHLLCVAVWGC